MSTFIYNGLKIDSETVSIDDMPSEVFREIYENCGVDVALSLLINMYGATILVPTRGMLKIEKRVILKEYDGTTASIRNIARKFRMSETYIRETLRQSKVTLPAEGQTSLKLFSNN